MPQIIRKMGPLIPHFLYVIITIISQNYHDYPNISGFVTNS